MKHYGNNFEYEEERNADLMRAYRKCLASFHGHIDSDRLWKDVANTPSCRYWVSEERAYTVVRRMLNGEDVPCTQKEKRDMYHEIAWRTERLQKKHPYLGLKTCVSIVVNSKAPRFFMTPLSVRETIYKIRRGWYDFRRPSKG